MILLFFFSIFFFFFFFNDTATTEIYTLSLHDALPISQSFSEYKNLCAFVTLWSPSVQRLRLWPLLRSEEHTSELQSHVNLVCRLLLEKKKNYHSLKLNDEKKKIKKQQ